MLFLPLLPRLPFLISHLLCPLLLLLWKIVAVKADRIVPNKMIGLSPAGGEEEVRSPPSSNFLCLFLLAYFQMVVSEVSPPHHRLS